MRQRPCVGGEAVEGGDVALREGTCFASRRCGFDSRRLHHSGEGGARDGRLHPVREEQLLPGQGPEAFRSWCKGLGLEIIQNEEQPDLYGFIAGEGIPPVRLDPETGEEEEIDFFAELAGHLAEGQVAEVREIGHEKMRYLIGITRAVRWDGEMLEIDLDDIYDTVAAQ